MCKVGLLSLYNECTSADIKTQAKNKNRVLKCAMKSLIIKFYRNFV